MSRPKIPIPPPESSAPLTMPLTSSLRPSGTESLMPPVILSMIVWSWLTTSPTTAKATMNSGKTDSTLK